MGSEMKCDKCGKEMADENGHTLAGLTIEVSTTENASPEMIAAARRQVGKYQLNREYSFCFECWIDSLMRGGNTD